MSNWLSFFTILGFGLIAGIRHGIDFDHIAAITDITSSQKRSSAGFLYSALYGLGHGVMVIILGTILLILGQNLPETVNSSAQKLVGITLLVLGLYVLISITRSGKKYRMKSRWMLILDIINSAYHKLLHNFGLTNHHPKVKEEKYGPASAAGIGLIHGIGAETPTQIGAFLVLLGIGRGVKGIMFLVFFVLGIFISNLAVAGLSLYGFKKMVKNGKLYLGIGIITAVFSLALGVIFLLY